MNNKTQWMGLIVGMVLVLGLGTHSFAETTEEEGLVDFIKKVVDFPVEAGKETVDYTVKTGENVVGAAGNAIEGTGEGLHATGAATHEVVVEGKVEKTPEIVTKPVEKAVETTVELVEETATAGIHHE